MQKIIAYHGTDREFDSFKLPEYCGDLNFNAGNLGIYFSESKEIARLFCKEKWYSRTSPFKENSRIITVELMIINPRFVYPIEHASSRTKEQHILYRRYLYTYYNHDCIIIQKSNGEKYACSSDGKRLPFRCEFGARQFVMFFPQTISIKDVEYIKSKR